MGRREGRRQVGVLGQLRIFTVEYFQMLMGDRRSLAISIGFPFLAVLILVFIAGDDMFLVKGGFGATKSGDFIVVSAAIWGGLFNSIQTIVRDRPNIRRSFVAGASLESYLLSRALLQMLLCLLQSAVLALGFLALVHRNGHHLPDEGVLLQNTVLELFAGIFLLMYAADAMGLMISCLVRKAESASVLAPYVLIVQLIFSGILFEMKGAAKAISALMISRWGMEALGTTSHLNHLQAKFEAKGNPIIVHAKVDPHFTYTAEHLRHVWLVLLLFIVAFLVLGILFLHRISKDTRE